MLVLVGSVKGNFPNCCPVTVLGFLLDFHQLWASRTRHSPLTTPIMPSMAGCICHGSWFMVRNKVCQKGLQMWSFKSNVRGTSKFATKLLGGKHMFKINRLGSKKLKIWPICSCSQNLSKHMNSVPSYRLVYMSLLKQYHNITTKQSLRLWVGQLSQSLDLGGFFVFNWFPKLELLGHLEMIPVIQTIKVIKGSVEESTVLLS